jgi:hypothetical protein
MLTTGLICENKFFKDYSVLLDGNMPPHITSLVSPFKGRWAQDFLYFVCLFREGHIDLGK